MPESSSDALESSRRLIQELRAQLTKQAGGARADLLETHISWVLLSGDFAYKLKKPVDLGFVDFTTLEQRRFCCNEELRLNGRLAPDIYLDVVPIAGSVDAPELGGSGEPIEFAVRMKRFPQEALLAHVLERGALLPSHVDDLARIVADFHASSDRAPEASRFGNEEHVQQPVRVSFEQLARSLAQTESLHQVDRLRAWSESEFARRRDDFRQRKQCGAIRECHGDMHLGNMVLIDDRVTIFDCIEFNPDLRWIDVISEAAFVTMDLESRGRRDFAGRFLNGYLERTGDYGGLVVHAYYAAYRALVRAKVACLRAAQGGIAAAQQRELADESRSYLGLAETYSRPRHPYLAITHGVSGTGKTWGTQILVDETAAIRVRSDVERKRLFGFDPEQRSDPARIDDVYSPQTTRRTYDRVKACAHAALRAGVSVVVDAACLKRWQRELFRDLAAERSVPFRILDFRASEATLRERVQRRQERGRDASEADLAVLEQQLETREPLGTDELAAVIEVDSENPSADERLLAAIKQL
jgi:aminoglycoside phosphotransferase family enzyme/predicted kinase